MLTSERQRLLSTMSPETVGAFRFMKLGSCLALVTLLLVIGSAREKQDVANDARAQAGHSESAAKATTAAAHRKEVFDARRARFAGKASGVDAAGLAPISSAEAATFAPPARHSAAAVIAPPTTASSDATSKATCSGGGDGGMDATGNQCNE